MTDNRSFLEDFWSDDLLDELLGVELSDSDLDQKLEIEPQLIRSDLLFRIIHLVHEEISTYSRLVKETKLLREFLTNLANAMNFKEGEDYFRSVSKNVILADIPNLTSTLSTLISGSSRLCQKFPVDIAENSRAFFLICIYGAAFRGYSLRQTNEHLTTERLSYIIRGKTERIPDDLGTCDISQLLNYLSMVDTQDWFDIPVNVRLPILQILSKYTGSFHKFSSQIQGSMKTLHAIFGREEIYCGKAKTNPVQFIEVDSAKWDGLDCLNAQNSYLTELFPTDLRTDTVRDLLSSNVSHAAADVNLDLSNEPDRIMAMAEERLSQVSNRTVARCFGRGLATLGSIKMVDTQKLQFPKLDFSLRLPAGYTRLVFLIA